MTSGWSNGLTANRFDAAMSANSGAPGAARTITLNPNGNWNGQIITPDVGGNGTISPASLTVPTGSTTAETFTYTPASAGAVSISFTATGGLSVPYPVPYTCMSAASGTARTLTPAAQRSSFKTYRTWHRSTFSGTPNGFSGTFTKGRGKVFFTINPAGASSGVFLRLYDRDSSGATTTARPGTMLQDVVQVYGAVSAGSQEFASCYRRASISVTRTWRPMRASRTRSAFCKPSRSATSQRCSSAWSRTATRSTGSMGYLARSIRPQHA